VLEVAQSETCSARARPRRDVAPASAPTEVAAVLRRSCDVTCTPEQEVTPLLKAAVPPSARTPRRPSRRTRAAPAPWGPAATSSSPPPLAPLEPPPPQVAAHWPRPHREKPPPRPHSLAAGELLAGAAPHLSNTPNRGPSNPRPSPRPVPAKNAGELTEFRRSAPAARPQDYIPFLPDLLK
jgi:hypothetical protein